MFRVKMNMRMVIGHGPPLLAGSFNFWGLRPEEFDIPSFGSLHRLPFVATPGLDLMTPAVVWCWVE